MSALPASTEHRPWPVPRGPWVMAQSWHDLLFAHWAVDPARVQATLPPGLDVDTREGRAWVGVVPFRMSGIRLRLLPEVPGTNAFPELNVRTYVIADGKPGVWFYSLDAQNALAVAVARAWFRLPYFRARMTCQRDGDDIRYASVRTHRGAPSAEVRGRYGPASPPRRAAPGTLEHWLTERYCLYAAKRGHLLRGEIHHAPWPLQDAWAELETETVSRAAGFDLAGDPLVHFARSIDVVCWSPVRVVTTRG